MKPIYEYEFGATKNGRHLTVQQSAHNEMSARHLIKRADHDIILGKKLKRLSYPHSEGGGKV